MLIRKKRLTSESYQQRHLMSPSLSSKAVKAASFLSLAITNMIYLNAFLYLFLLVGTLQLQPVSSQNGRSHIFVLFKSEIHDKNVGRFYIKDFIRNHFHRITKSFVIYRLLKYIIILRNEIVLEHNFLFEIYSYLKMNSKLTH